MNSEGRPVGRRRSFLAKREHDEKLTELKHRLSIERSLFMRVNGLVKIAPAHDDDIPELNLSERAA